MNQDNPFAKGVSINQDIVYEERFVDPESNTTLPVVFSVNTGEPKTLTEMELLALGREEE